MLQCQALVDQLGLFSSNEDAEDLATAGWDLYWNSMLHALLLKHKHLVLLMCRFEVYASTSYAW